MHTTIRLLLLAISVAGLAACQSAAQPPAPVRPAIVVQPQPSNNGAEVFIGEVRARHESSLGFRVGGKLRQRHVEVGEQVTRNQRLATLDPEDLQLQVAAQRAALASAQADLQLAQAERDRHRALLERKLISASLFDARETAHRAAQARMQQVQAQLDVARNQAGYAELRADADGVVTALFAEAGQVLAAGQPVLTLARDGDREVSIALPEHRLGDFKVGQPALVEVWGAEGERHPAQVREIAPEATAAGRTYGVRVKLDGDTPAQLGQTARVYFAHNGGPKLHVPLSALHEHDGAPALWVLDRDTQTLRLVPVQIGAYGEHSVAVLGGVGAQDWIVSAGVHLLREGQQVRPIDYDNRRVEL